MPEMISAEKAICQAPPRACIYAISEVGGGPEETGFLIRERSGIIAELGRSPEVHVRATLFREGAVLLLPVLLKVSGELYECWVNSHAEGGRQALECLAIQERIGIHFYNDAPRRVRSIAIPNCLHPFWRFVLSELAVSAPWPMPAFDIAREAIYRVHPTPRDLWRALRDAPTPPEA